MSPILRNWEKCPSGDRKSLKSSVRGRNAELAPDKKRTNVWILNSDMERHLSIAYFPLFHIFLIPNIRASQSPFCSVASASASPKTGSATMRKGQKGRCPTLLQSRGRGFSILFVISRICYFHLPTRSGAGRFDDESV